MLLICQKFIKGNTFLLSKLGNRKEVCIYMTDFYLEEEKFRKISGYLSSGYRDYLAARTLLINGLIYRGVIVSATSIEKLLKVFLVLKNNPKKTHNVSKLFTEAVKFDSELQNQINNDFIELLSKSYKLRYFDDDIFNYSKGKFQLTVAQYKTLAELDFTAITLLNSFKVEFMGQELESEYHENLKENYRLLYDENFVLSKISKKEFVERKQQVYQIRTVQNGIMERTFYTEDAKEDGIFIFPGEQ